MENSELILEKYREIIPDFNTFIETMKTPQPYWLRVNTLKIGEQKLIRRLENKGFVLERYGKLNAYRVVEMPVKHPGATLEHSLGYYYIQDLASMMPALALGPGPGDIVLDMAAAPGSKTSMMAQMMNNTGTIIANDVNIGRIKALSANIERLGITNTIITKKNAAKASFGKCFKKILLDAPCSSEGTLRKAPMERIPGENEYANYSKLQKEMLSNAARHLCPGGTLVYSTCTFNPLENEKVVAHGIQNLGLIAEKVTLPVPTEPGVRRWNGEELSHVSEYVARIYPHRVDTGGMFIAVLKKQ